MSLTIKRAKSSHYGAEKLQTVVVPASELSTSIPQLLKLVTVACSVRNLKLLPTEISVPPAGVTKIE